MLRKLTQEQQDRIVSSAIELFGEYGVERTSIADIAGKSGVSVGVIYKYYDSKQGLFETCLKKSLEMLNTEISDAVGEEADVAATARKLVLYALKLGEKNPSYLKMYHMITVLGTAEEKKKYAEMIEQYSARHYREMIRRAQENGTVKSTMPPEMLAYFFDCLLMALHFSCACDYYMERQKVYLGREVTDEELADAMVRFLSEGMKIEK